MQVVRQYFFHYHLLNKDNKTKTAKKTVKEKCEIIA